MKEGQVRTADPLTFLVDDFAQQGTRNTHEPYKLLLSEIQRSSEGSSLFKKQRRVMGSKAMTMLG